VGRFLLPDRRRGATVHSDKLPVAEAELRGLGSVRPDWWRGGLSPQSEERALWFSVGPFH